MEKTLELEIRSLLPGVESDQDACILRLENALQNQRNLKKAHLERQDGGVKLCLHFDSERTSVIDVKRIAQRAGVEIVNRYRHELISIKGMDCSDCAMVIEHSLGRMPGVLSARVNYASKKLWIEYDSHVLAHRGIEQRIRNGALCDRQEGNRPAAHPPQGLVGDPQDGQNVLDSRTVTQDQSQIGDDQRGVTHGPSLRLASAAGIREAEVPQCNGQRH